MLSIYRQLGRLSSIDSIRVQYLVAQFKFQKLVLSECGSTSSLALAEMGL